MRRLACLLIALLLILQSAIAHAAPEPALAVDAYVTRGQTLIVTVFSDQPTNVQLSITLPLGWTADNPLAAAIPVSVARVLRWHLTPSAGLGLVRVEARDGRGNAASDTAYSEGARPAAARAQGVWLAVIRR